MNLAQYIPIAVAALIVTVRLCMLPNTNQRA